MPFKLQIPVDEPPHDRSWAAAAMGGREKMMRGYYIEVVDDEVAVMVVTVVEATTWGEGEGISIVKYEK